jgi:hypothetical protein
MRSGLAGVVSLAFAIASSQIATPAQAAPAPTPPAAAAEALPSADNGASSDTQAIVDAADDYRAGDAAAAADLAEAASAADAVPMIKTKGGLAATSDSGASVKVTTDGEVTISAPDAPKIGISVDGTASTTRVVDGALVQTDVAPSTDIVTRATGDGVQMVAVLGDSEAPSAIRFPVTLPDGASLVGQPDGSVAVIAPVETQTVPDDQMEAFTAEVAHIVGESVNVDQVSDAQWAQLSALKTPKTVTEVANQQVAVVGAPWAVDADGEPVSTHYELAGGVLTQVVDTDADTAFPVTADPEWWWWAWTATSCVADLASFVFAAAKLAKVLIKVSSLIRKSATVARWITKLGGAEKTLKTIYYAAKGFLESGKVGKYLSHTTVLALSSFAASGLTLLGDALGIGSCVSLVRELL